MKKTLKKLTQFALLTSVGFSTLLSTNVVDAEENTDWQERSVEEIKTAIEEALATNGVYQIQWGDTLSAIAQALGVSVQVLVDANNIVDAHFIQAGTTLTINEAAHTVTLSNELDAVTVSLDTGAIVEEAVEVYDLSPVVDAEMTNTWEIQAAPAVEAVETYAEPADVAPVVEEVVAAEAVEAPAPQTIVEEISPAEVAESLNLEAAAVEPVVEAAPVVEEEVAPVVEETPAAVEEVAAPAPAQTSGRQLTVEATAYSYTEPGLSNRTADGTDLTQDSRVIAVDPNVIPLGSMVEVEGYGVYRAADTGGAINGNKIDLHFNSVDECNEFGRRTLNIRVLD